MSTKAVETQGKGGVLPCLARPSSAAWRAAACSGVSTGAGRDTRAASNADQNIIFCANLRRCGGECCGGGAAAPAVRR